MASFLLKMVRLQARSAISALTSPSSKCSRTSNYSSPTDRHPPNWGHPDHDACGTGFIARLGGAPSYEIIQHSLTALERLTHRGGVDADGASGDGAGLLTSLPQAFFRAR